MLLGERPFLMKSCWDASTPSFQGSSGASNSFSLEERVVSVLRVVLGAHSADGPQANEEKSIIFNERDLNSSDWLDLDHSFIVRKQKRNAKLNALARKSAYFCTGECAQFGIAFSFPCNENRLGVIALRILYATETEAKHQVATTHQCN